MQRVWVICTYDADDRSTELTLNRDGGCSFTNFRLNFLAFCLTACR
jgi:hypothetical protein